MLRAVKAKLGADGRIALENRGKVFVGQRLHGADFRLGRRLLCVLTAAQQQEADPAEKQVFGKSHH